jgi:hypothetical protein
MRTNGNRFDLNAFLDVGGARIVGVLVTQDGLTAERVDKGGPTCSSDPWLAAAALCSTAQTATHQYPRRRKPSGRTGCPS